jgi:hypothetical protein
VRASDLIGHLIGKLACSYADGALSQCEAISYGPAMRLSAW